MKQQVGKRVGSLLIITVIALEVAALYLYVSSTIKPSLAELNAESAQLQVRGTYSFVSEGDIPAINGGKDSARFVILLKHETDQKIWFKAYYDQKFLPGQSVYIEYLEGDYYVFANRPKR